MNNIKCKICNSDVTEEPRTRDGVTINCTHCGKYFVSGSLFIEDYTDESNFYKLSSWIREQHDEFRVNVPELTTENGFNYVVVNQDNVEHNKSINDEIIVKLKSSRIVIADFTNHRKSVYFEAGFAMGMNIPIIWTCQEGHEDDMSFDTRQFPHIVWKDKDDLVKQIIDRIKVIL